MDPKKESKLDKKKGGKNYIYTMPNKFTISAHAVLNNKQKTIDLESH